MENQVPQQSQPVQQMPIQQVPAQAQAPIQQAPIQQAPAPIQKAPIQHAVQHIALEPPPFWEDLGRTAARGFALGMGVALAGAVVAGVKWLFTPSAPAAATPTPAPTADPAA
jgi:uncharacterized protein involved in propanediol utilization